MFWVFAQHLHISVLKLPEKSINHKATARLTPQPNAKSNTIH